MNITRAFCHLRLLLVLLGCGSLPALAQIRSDLPPVLRASSLTTAATVTAGEHVGLSFLAERGSGRVRGTTFRFTDPNGQTVTFTKDDQDLGSAIVETRRDWALGRYRLEQVEMWAENTSGIVFFRDGTVRVRKTDSLFWDVPPTQAPTSHAVAFANLDFIVQAPASGTQVSGALAGDTRWTKEGSPYHLMANVVVLAGTTLTIEAGAKVIGAGQTIEVAGTLNVIGSATSPAVLSQVRLLPTSAVLAQPFLIRIERAAVYGGAIWPNTLGTVYGTLHIRDSVLVDVSAARTVIRYPTSDAIIERNVFYHCAGMTLGTGGGTAGGITVRHNVFFEPDVKSDDQPASVDAVFLVFAQSGGTVTLRGNSFVGVNSFPALRMPTGATAPLDASGNYFDPRTLAAGMVLSNSPGLPAITVEPNLSAPDSATPAPPLAPTVTQSPMGQTVTAGGAATFTVQASGSGELWYQWYKDGAPLPGATSSTLVVPGATAVDVGTYTVSIGNYAGTTTASPATLAVAGDAGPLTNWLSNVSIRTALQADQTPVLVGFATNGAKSILVRAAGPTLADHGVESPMADPRITLYAGAESTPLATNDDWAPDIGALFGQLGAFPFRTGSKDAALLQAIQGPTTAHATGIGAGVVLVEAYDADPGSGTTRLVNVSARNHVGTGADVLITGFVIQGTGAKRLLIRGIGPKLADYNVTAILHDPKLEVFTATGERIAANDNWDGSLASTFQATGAFPLSAGSKDAALIVTLPANASYSVQLSGVDGGIGQALVEVYEVP